MRRVREMKVAIGGMIAAVSVAAVLGISAGGAGAQEAGAGAAPLSGDQMRRRLLDACIIEIWRRPEMKEIRETAVARCQCASGKAVKTVTAVDVANISYTQPLVGPARDAILAALQTCGG